MTPQKINEVVNRIESDLQTRFATAAKRMNTRRTMSQLSEQELAQHALHLCSGIKSMLLHSDFPEGKIGRHLGSLQTICSFLDLYTLDEMMEMNRP